MKMNKINKEVKADRERPQGKILPHHSSFLIEELHEFCEILKKAHQIAEDIIKNTIINC